MNRQTPEQITGFLPGLEASGHGWKVLWYLSDSNSHRAQGTPSGTDMPFGLLKTTKHIFEVRVFFFYSKKSFLTKATEFGDVSFQTIIVSAHCISAVKSLSP